MARGNVSAAGFAAVGSVFCFLASAHPLVTIAPTARATGLPVIGSVIGEFPTVAVSATPGARAGFVVAGALGAGAAFLAAAGARRLLVAVVAVAAAAFPATVAVVSWHTIRGGPDAVANRGATFLQQLGGQALAFAERTDLATLRAGGATYYVTAGAACLLVAAFLAVVGRTAAQRGTKAQ
jgi:hypothetical protein